MTNPVLVIGGNSLLGQTVALELTQAGRRVLCTTRRPQRAQEKQNTFLDLASTQTPANLLSIKPHTVIFCAALTSQKACEDDQLTSMQVNVNSVFRISQEFLSMGSNVVYMSSNAVFSGQFPHTSATSPITASSVYGKQKAEAETRLLTLGNKICILRFSKLSHSLLPLIKGWAESVSNKNIIYPFSNAPLSPVSTQLAARAVRLVAERPIPGISQLSASRDISYADAAYFLANKLGWPINYVHPVNSIDHSGIVFPDYTTMDCSKLASFGIDSPEPELALDDLATKMREECRS